jgi:hypothetical protein
MLAGVIEDGFYPIYEVRHVVSAGKFIVRGSPEKQVTGQAASLPDAKLAGVKRVVTLVDVL